MTPAAEEARRLFRLAERDRTTFVLLVRMPQAPLSAVGFHAQQAVEKALKAVAAQHEIETRRTHDLVALAQALLDASCAVPFELEPLRRLNPFAVEMRYEDELAPVTSREELEETVQRVLDWAEHVIFKSAPDGSLL